MSDSKADRWDPARNSLVIVLALTLTGCMSYLPGRQTYWDDKVKALCDEDGGVRIFEKLHISKADIDVLGTADGEISIPIRELAHPNAPVYAVHQRTNIRTEEPYVWRT